MTPLLSIVIPVYNHADTIVACLKALETQTEQRFEVVLVDDGSSDDLVRTLQEAPFSRPYKLIRFDQNRGAPAARNEGARRTSGAYLLFLDADATLIPRALAKMKEVLDTHPEIAFAYPDLQFGWKRFPGQAFNSELLKKMNYIHTSALIRRTSFPGFDESLKKFQDWDLWLTIMERGGKGMRIPEVLFSIKTRATGYSQWLPKIAYRIPWPIFGYTPREVLRYRKAQAIIQTKHAL